MSAVQLAERGHVETHDETPAPVIRTVGLTKRYAGGLLAVDGLSLSVQAGEIFGLLGPNGAGKTTTVGMLTTRVLPTAGYAQVGGVDVVAEPARAKQAIGVVPQSNTLDRDLTVGENLYFHGRYFGFSPRAARAATRGRLAQFRLADREHTPVATLSGGMAQRLMLARAVLHEPRILFLDEPTAGLDPQSRIALWEVLGELGAAGQTILLTTHYMEEAERLCHRVAIMDHGRILALDTPTALKRSLGAEAVVRVAVAGQQSGADLRRLADRLARVDGARSAQVGDGAVVVYVAGVAARALPRVITATESGGFTLTDLSVTEPTLETVFINLTGKELRD
ncbi:MAG: ABC transporter ATP-binding protein [Acidimicrobiia bacterium]